MLRSCKDNMRETGNSAFSSLSLLIYIYCKLFFVLLQLFFKRLFQHIHTGLFGKIILIELPHFNGLTDLNVGFTESKGNYASCASRNRTTSHRASTGYEF